MALRSFLRRPTQLIPDLSSLHMPTLRDFQDSSLAANDASSTAGLTVDTGVSVPVIGTDRLQSDSAALRAQADVLKIDFVGAFDQSR